MRERLSHLLKLAVGVGLLYFLFRRLEDPAQLRQQISSANVWLLLMGAACYASAVALSAVKWGVLLRAVRLPVPIRRLLAYQWMAEFFNNFLPAQVGGDVMRGYALAVDTHRNADAAASILIDRFLGLLVFMVSAAVASVAMFLWGRPGGAELTGEQLLFMRLIALGSTAAAVMLLVLLASLLSRRLKQRAEWLFQRLPFASRTVPVWQKLAQAFNAYRHAYPALLLSALISVVIVVLTSVNIWLITNALVPGAIGLGEVLAINPIIVFIGLFVPFLPGGLGVRQGAFYSTFYLIGRNGDLGFAVGLLQQLIGLFVSLPGGYLWVRGRPRREPASLPAESPVEPQLR
ncbi:MAG TPA: lysylphosphatidylglycerol synthase transmembrane domain-containing protein [Caldilineaceae bacterium]|nr:lysylphosphatidylglycerol synthase transmembrane domain-containing protein [Caldilineaceae bacterium]